MRMRRLLQQITLGLSLTGLLICTAVFAFIPANAAQLINLEEDGCSWCERWHQVVGLIPDNTRESKYTLLRRVDVHEDLPDDLSFVVKGGYTPTFILIDDDREIGRIRDYSGEESSCGLLAKKIRKRRRLAMSCHTSTLYRTQ
ncbi:MAG: transcriptional regulator [Hyphomicrobiaceae bacterium]